MKKYEKITAYIMLTLLVVSLIPVMYLGRYNHATGDDYYYGVYTHQVWQETGNLLKTVSEACKGVWHEYNNWQGTYSAMFLMYLPPNVFSEQAYKWITTVILLLLTGGVFFLTKPLVCDVAKGSKFLWALTASGISLVCIQTVPSQGETFFWYNGSMYYTGYFALTLFFFGGICRYLLCPKRYWIPVLLLLSLFLAGGNYVSLLPALLLVTAITGVLILKKEKKMAAVMGSVALAMLLGLAVSAMAPGNAVRQSGMWKIPAWKAVAKSLVQGVRYALAWIRTEWLLIGIIMIPAWWKSYRESTLQFRYPVPVIGFAYGVFCSMSCPTFYTMNSTGPARAVAIVYYGFVLTTYFCAYYLLGYVRRCMKKKREQSQNTAWIKGLYTAAILLLLTINICSGAGKKLTTIKAVQSLASGEAKRYEEEYLYRLGILQDESITDAVLPAYVNRPDMLYVGDFAEDATTINNKQVALYFGKNTVGVVEFSE